MSSREKILSTLRAAPRPFADMALAPESYLPMVPLEDLSPSTLVERFVVEAEKLAAVVHQTASPSAAIETILEILDGDQSIISWDAETISLPNVMDTLAAAGVRIAEADDPSVRVGLSGATAALAATGSLVLASDTGQYRNASLLPPVHIAIVTTSQIMPDFESWIAEQRANQLERFRRSSNIVLISGPSKTADIAMELILGMHGPGELHVVLVEDNDFDFRIAMSSE